MTTRAALKTVPVCSLWDLAEREALNHKWLLSERSGYDIGPAAFCDWSRRYWRIFCRYRRLDHLLGHRKIREFDQGSFGCLRDPQLCARPVVRFVLKHFAEDGWENLQFFTCPVEREFSIWELCDALTLVDVNSVRFDPPWL